MQVGSNMNIRERPEGMSRKQWAAEHNPTTGEPWKQPSDLIKEARAARERLAEERKRNNTRSIG